MIQWVHERVVLARAVDRVLVATDDERIRACVEGFGGTAIMTSPHHASGTDRLAEVVRAHPADVIVNIQGDEPLIEPQAVDEVVEVLLGDLGASMATLATPLRDAKRLLDPNVVKVVVDGQGRALYFSRSPIPHLRDGADPRGVAPGALAHVGLYAYRRDFLLRFCEWTPGPLERAERLEQLRALENGAMIRVGITAFESLAVDTPADVAAVEARLTERSPPSTSTPRNP